MREIWVQIEVVLVSLTFARLCSLSLKYVSLFFMKTYQHEVHSNSSVYISHDDNRKKSVACTRLHCCDKIQKIL